MADTEKKTRLSKAKPGYGYKYTELSQINELLEERGESYYQYTETFNGQDYIMTVKIAQDGTASEPMRGLPILTGNIVQKANVMQQLGAATTYARRYSLLLAYGLATEDDDAECLTEKKESKSTNIKGINMPVETESINEPKLTEQHLNIIIKACANANTDMDAEAFWKKRYKVNNLADINDSEFDVMLKGMKCDHYGNYKG